MGRLVAAQIHANRQSGPPGIMVDSKPTGSDGFDADGDNNGPIRGIASAKAGHGAIEGKGHWAGRPARFSKNSKKVIAPIRVIPILCAPVSPKRQNDEFGR